MKKWLCTVLAVRILTGILTGCGSTSGQEEADTAGTGDWQDGQRFSSAADEQDVKDWVYSLNIMKKLTNKFTKSSQKISTHLLTVLIIGAITIIEQRKRNKKKEKFQNFRF